MVDICIIGAGTAGLTAAIYGLRAGKSVLVLEANSYGGQIINTMEIENYPGISSISGYEFATGLYNQANALGMKLEFDKAIGIDRKENYFILHGNMGDYEARTVITAPGVRRRHLDVPGEEKFLGLGVSYCATCDGAFFRNKPVAVAGGGNTALDEAIFLSNYCSRVYLIHRRDSFRGEGSKLEILKKRENVSIITDATILSINGADKVSSVSYRDKLSGKCNELDIEAIFIAVGQVPDTEFLKNTVSLDDAGYIVSGEECLTDIEGIYAAGDCRTKKIRQLTTAAADGTVAALNACNFLDK